MKAEGRILTTHTGSLPRPPDLLDMLKAHLVNPAEDPDPYAARVRRAVAEIVRGQIDHGIDIVSDGEQGKAGFFTYVTERLTGFEPRPDLPRNDFPAEVSSFPDYYREYFSRAMAGGAIAPLVTILCTGPVSYQGHDAVQQDIENLKAALRDAPGTQAFIPAVAPAGVGANGYYPTEEAYLYAVADAMREEYRAIVNAGFLLQVDDPFLTDVFGNESLTTAERRRNAERHVEVVNHALRGIAPEMVRYHTCYGINEGPRIHDVPLAAIADLMLQVNAGAYSFEAANARHEHEYHVWETVKLPDGKRLIPGVITHTSNIVEHPELVSERIVRFAERVGRDRVMAGTDCGFSSLATYHPEVHPTVVWAKFRALAEGARLASERLRAH